MADEPNRLVEQALKKAAEQRRQNAVPELHPATRRMLQDEVKRTYRTGAKREGNWLRAILPHLAVAGAITVVLGVILYGFKSKQETVATASVPEPQPTMEERGRVEQLQKVEAAADASPAPVELGLQVESREEDAKQKEAKDSLKLEGPAQAPATVAPRVQPEGGTEGVNIRRYGLIPAKTEAVAEPEIVRERLVDTNVKFTAEQPAPAKVVIDAAAVPAETLALLTNVEQVPPPPLAQVPVGEAAKAMNLGAAFRRDFVAVTNMGQPAPMMLAKFQLEQLGEQVRFTETNGFVYVGSLISHSSLPKDYFSASNLAEAQVRTTTASTRARPALPGLTPTNYPPPPGTAAWMFRATGFSQTLGREVIFEGQYFDPTNRVPAREQVSTNRPRLEMPTVLGRVTTDGTNWNTVRAVAPR